MHWLVWIVAGLLAAMFLVAGWSKVSGSEMQRKGFAERGQSLGFMHLIGALELAGALGLVVGFWVPILALLAAIGLTIIMVGAVFTHVRAKDPLSRATPALVLLLLSLVEVIGRLITGV